MSEENTEETKVEICKCVRCRIKRFRLMQSLSSLPTKPVSKIVGKHEYLRLDDVNDKYWTEFEHDLKVEEVTGRSNCTECSFYFTKEEVEAKYKALPCYVKNFNSTLDVKLQELKSLGRKVLNTRREWDGWTIKMMVPAT